MNTSPCRIEPECLPIDSMKPLIFAVEKGYNDMCGSGAER